MSSDNRDTPALRPEVARAVMRCKDRMEIAWNNLAGPISVIVAELERLAAENAALKAELATLRSQLSRIDYAFGEPNEMRCSPYDVDLDGERVVRQVEAILKGEAKGGG